MNDQHPVEDELPKPQIPSVNDPFNLKDCDQYPNPLSANEDIILKHILGICSSDYQMSKRAYDSIVCMWAKNKAGAGGCLPATLIQAYPTTANVAPVGNFIALFLYGTDIQPGANILYKGLLGVNPYQGVDGPAGPGAGPYVSAIMDFTDTSKFVTGPIPVAIINPSKVMSNILSINIVKT